MISLETNKLKINIEGESHSKEIFLTLKGVKKNTKYDPFLLEKFIQRRKAGKDFETKRWEIDMPTIISGIKNLKFSKNEVKMSFTNEAISTKNYEVFSNTPRPGHADFARIKKYGSLFYKGSDIYSGRMTLPLVAAGALCKMHLLDVKVDSEIININGVTDKEKFDSILKQSVEDKNSLGAIIKLTVKNVIPGIGFPEVITVDSLISSLLFRVPGVKGVSFGAGFDGVNLKGLEFNDIIINEKGQTRTNNSGGINSGLTNGNDIIVNVFLRPASSVKLPQKTFNFETGKMDQLNIKGSHDIFYQERARVVLESMIYIALYDLYLLSEE